MNTPSEWHCTLIRRALHSYASDVKTEAKKVRALGFAAEAENLNAAAETITESILPLFGEAPEPKGGPDPQMTIDDAIAEAERATADGQPAPSGDLVQVLQLPPGLTMAEPSGEVVEDDATCLHCGGPIPEGRGFEFCSDACEKAFTGAAQADGVVVDADNPESGWEAELCEHGVPLLQPCAKCAADPLNQPEGT